MSRVWALDTVATVWPFGTYSFLPVGPAALTPAVGEIFCVEPLRGGPTGGNIISFLVGRAIDADGYNPGGSGGAVGTDGKSAYSDECAVSSDSKSVDARGRAVSVGGRSGRSIGAGELSLGVDERAEGADGRTGGAEGVEGRAEGCAGAIEGANGRAEDADGRTVDAGGCLAEACELELDLISPDEGISEVTTDPMDNRSGGTPKSESAARTVSNKGSLSSPISIGSDRVIPSVPSRDSEIDTSSAVIPKRANLALNSFTIG